MDNLDIKNKIIELQSQFDISLMTLNPKNKQIIADILALQSLCTHRVADGKYAISENNICEYCGKYIK